jgi:SAM-dependent methyltransferase
MPPYSMQAVAAAVSLSLGLLVIVRSNRIKAPAKVKQGRVLAKTYEDRHDTSKGKARRSRFRGGEGDTTVVCVPNQQEYTKSVKYFVGSEDVVLELGCQRGETTQTLLETAKRVVGIDIMRKEDGSEETTENSDNLTFLRTSVWSNKIPRGEQFSVIYVDLTVVTGNDLLFDGIALVQQLINTFQSSLRFVVIKSRRLREHACCFRNADSFIKDLDPWIVDKRDKDRVKVLGAVGVQQYRNAIDKVVHEGYHALEIGAHFGCTTKLLHERVGPTGSAVGVDIGKKALARASGKFPGVCFMEASAWDTHALVKICAKFDVIFIDIGGVSGYDGLLEGVALITQLINAYRPSLKAIVVKSRAMRDHANLFITGEELMYDLKTGATLDTHYHTARGPKRR